MEHIKQFICFSLGITNVLLLLYLIFFIFNKRKFLYFSKCLPICNCIIIFIFLIEQIICVAISYYARIEELQIVGILSLLKGILTDFYLCIPVIIRTIPMLQMAQFSYNHLSKIAIKNNRDKGKKKNDYFTWRKNNPNQDDFYKSFILLYIFSISIALFCLLNYVEKIKTYLLMFYQPYLNIVITLEIFHQKIFLAYVITMLSLVFLSISFYLILLIKILLYPVADHCLIIIEAFIYLIPLIGYTVMRVISQYHYLTTYSFKFLMIKTSISLSFAIGELFLWSYRSNINEKSINKIILNYPIFMLNSICFSYLKSFMSSDYTSNVRYIEFWESHYHYQLKIKNKNKFKYHKQEMILEAYNMYQHYFYQKKTFFEATAFTVMNASYLTIPDEIMNIVNRKGGNCFTLKTKELKELFLESYNYINGKLKNIYRIILNTKNERNLLLSILANSAFDDIQESFEERMYINNID